MVLEPSGAREHKTGGQVEEKRQNEKSEQLPNVISNNRTLEFALLLPEFSQSVQDWMG